MFYVNMQKQNYKLSLLGNRKRKIQEKVAFPLITQRLTNVSLLLEILQKATEKAPIGQQHGKRERKVLIFL